MTKPANPFAEFTKQLQGMKLPNFDMDAFVSMQQKNVEAMTAANQMVLDGFRAVFERQVQIAQQSISDAQAAVQDLTNMRDQMDMEKQAAAAKAAMEQAAAQVKELSEMATRSQTEAFDILNKRLMESIEEAKGQFNPK
ncbi:phasin family protein [Minwuia sp.]|uniref:phasin family protein n=1 Tax=Minwuia sp. TaxID=2493630 RepID=UPI003A95B00D